MEAFDAKTIYTMLHLFGVVLGMGGALYTDIVFSRAIRNRVISRDEASTISLMSTIIWVGLVVIIVSGLLLFSLDIPRYLHSSKFLAKMTIVLILAINGIFFHFFHLPLIKKNVDQVYSASAEFMKKTPLLLVSGAMSIVSWFTALILGSLRSLSFSYGEIMLSYGVLLIVSSFVALLLKKRVF